MTLIFVCHEAWPPPMLMSSGGKYEQEDCTNIGTLFVETTARNNAQKGASEKLLNLANVQVSIRGCGLEEIHRFQIFFATRATALVVYSFRNFARGYPPVYDGTRFVMDTHGCITNTLRIMYYENSNLF